MSSHQFPLMEPSLTPSAPAPFFLIPVILPAHSYLLQPLPSLYPFLPATHKFPTTPPTFSSIPPPLPALPSILHLLHSIRNLILISNHAGFQAVHRSPSRCPRSPGPAISVPLAPTPLPTLPLPNGALAPRPRPLPAEPPAFLTPPSAHGSGVTTPSPPPEGRSPERTRRHPPPRTPRPITGPAAVASSRDGLCHPRCCCRRRPSPLVRKEDSASPGTAATAATVGEFPRRQGRRAGGQVSRQAAEGGRLRQLGCPR